MKLLITLLILFSTIGCSPLDTADTISEETSTEAHLSSQTYTEAKVTRVVDGDTIIVDWNGQEERVRLISVDTPETVHPSKPVEPFGPEASEFAKEMLENKMVTLEFDVSERDRYGRLLAYVWIEDKMFNKMLLEQGLARVVVFPPDVKYVEEFREIEKATQHAELGIWSLENYSTEEKNSNTAKDKQEAKFIASKNSEVYHEIGCPGGANNISPSNAIYFNSEQEAIDSGRRMCHSKSCPLN